ncbi:MAG: lysylphosphatidylglycerol synthetase family protein [Alphaproteobacteria bacterium]|nr:lysylphosphatidylglycerol synthetase family protein [Alphaproteobacteria bacterium]
MAGSRAAKTLGSVLVRWAGPVLGLALLVGAAWVMQRELAGLKLADIGREMRALPVLTGLAALGLTVVSYLVLTIYDALGTRFVGHPLSYGKVAFASFTAYALSHNIGFSILSGAAIRYRLYVLWGLTPMQIAGVVAFTSLTFVLGGLVLGGASLILMPGAIPFLGGSVPAIILQLLGVGMWALVALYILAGRLRGRPLRIMGAELLLPGVSMAVAQTALATADVALVAGIFYVLLPETPGLNFLVFMAVYVSAYTTGLASNVPGGLGVFDAAILAGLAPFLSPAAIVSALLIFRFLYYILPLFLAGSLFALNELVLRRVAVLRTVGRVARWGDPFIVPTVTGAVVVGGLTMLLLGALPPLDMPLGWAGFDVPRSIVELSHFAASVIGAFLLVLAWGLSRRVRAAWALVVALMVMAVSLAILKNQPPVVPAFLGLILLFVLPFRRNFYRSASLFGEPFTPSWNTALATVLGGTLTLAAMRVVEIMPRHETWWEFVLEGDAPRGLRATAAAALALMLFGLTHFLRPTRQREVAIDAGIAASLAHMAGGRGVPRGHGVVFGDRSRAAIVYVKRNGIWVGLGDTLGDPDDRASAIWRFRDLCEQNRVDPAFYGVSPDDLAIYDEIGLTAFPLGPDGLPLPESRGDAPAAERYLTCRAERDLRTLLPQLPDLARLAASA